MSCFLPSPSAPSWPWGGGGRAMPPCTEWPARFTPARVCSILDWSSIPPHAGGSGRRRRLRRRLRRRRWRRQRRGRRRKRGRGRGRRPRAPRPRGEGAARPAGPAAEAVRTGARHRLPPPPRLRRSGGRKRWAPRRWRRRRQRRPLPSRGRRAASSPPRAPPGGPTQLAPQRPPSCRDACRSPRQPAHYPPSAAAAAASSAGRDPSPGGPGGGSGGGGRRRRRKPAGGPRGARGAEEESLGAGGLARRGRRARWRAPAGRAPSGQQIDGAGEVAAATAWAAHPASSRRGPGSKAARLRDWQAASATHSLRPRRPRGGAGRERGRGSTLHAPPLGAVRALIGPYSSRRRRRHRPRSSARPLWPLIPGAWERATGFSRLLASSSPGVDAPGPNVTAPQLLLLSVSSHGCDDELCVGHGATLYKANHVLFCSAVSFTPRTASGYIFPLFPSGGGALRMPAACPGPIAWR